MLPAIRFHVKQFFNYTHPLRTLLGGGALLGGGVLVGIFKDTERRCFTRT